MKPGSGNDPFADDEPEEPIDASDERRVREQERDVDVDVGADERGPTTAVTTALPQEEEKEEREPPYVLRRKTVKEGREITQLYLREEFSGEGERKLETRVEEIIGTDVAKLDLREAAYAVAQQHPAEIAELLREWGYEYR